MLFDNYGMCESCRTPDLLANYQGFKICQTCLPAEQHAESKIQRVVSNDTLALRKKRADISRQRKLLNRDKLQLVRRTNSG